MPITWRLRLLSCMMHRWIATVSAWKLIVELEFDAKLFLDATFDHILTWLYSFALQWTQSRRLGPWFKLVHFAMIDRSVQVFNCDSDTVFHHGLAVFIIGQFRSYFPTIGRCLGLVGMVLSELGLWWGWGEADSASRLDSANIVHLEETVFLLSRSSRCFSISLTDRSLSSGQLCSLLFHRCIIYCFASSWCGNKWGSFGLW